MESPATPVPPPLLNRSIYHQLANYAVYAVPGSIVLNLVLGSALSSAPPAIRSVLSLLPGLVLFSAIPAGIVALFGIRKHGRRALLWKGLFGTLVPIICLVCAVIAFKTVRDHTLRKRQQIEQFSK